MRGASGSRNDISHPMSFGVFLRIKNSISLFPLSPEKAYFLGLFAADGNITINKNGSHYVEFTSKDFDRVEFVKNLFILSNKISSRTDPGGSNRRYRIQIGSKSLCLDLFRMGFGPRKSHVLCCPKIPKKIFSHFVRGYFDGDGHVMFKHYYRKGRSHPSPFFKVVFTSCSKDFLQRLWVRLRAIGVVRKGTVILDDKIYRLVFATFDSLSLGRFMYNSHHYKETRFALARKQRVFVSASAFYRESTERKP